MNMRLTAIHLADIPKGRIMVIISIINNGQSNLAIGAIAAN